MTQWGQITRPHFLPVTNERALSIRMVRVSGRLRVKLALTEFEKNPRLLVWVSGCPCLEPVIQLNAADTDVVLSVDQPDVENESSHGSLCFKLLVDQDYPLEMSKCHVPTPNGAVPTVPTIVGCCFASLCSTEGCLEGLALSRPGTTALPKGRLWFTPDATLPLQVDVDGEADLCTEWTTRVAKEGRASEAGATETAKRDNHPIFDVAGDCCIPPEMFYAPRGPPFPEEAFERLLSAALFGSRTTVAELNAALDAWTVASLAQVAGPVMCRMLSYAGAAMRYVPDFMFHRAPPRPSKIYTHLVRCSIRGKAALAELCDIYEEPLITHSGDCEEAARLVYRACFSLRSTGDKFRSSTLRRIWKLSKLFVFVASIVGVGFSSAGEASARGIGGRKRPSGKDAHVVGFAIPVPTFRKMLVRSGYKEFPSVIKCDTPQEDALAAQLPVLLLEGTSLADPIQATPSEWDRTFGPNTPYAEGVKQSYGAVHRVNRVEPLSRAILLTEIRNFTFPGSDVESFYAIVTRMYTWDLAVFYGLHHTRFDVLGEDGNVGAYFSDLCAPRPNVRSLGLKTVGPMPPAVFRASMNALGRSEPLTELRVTDEPAFPYCLGKEPANELRGGDKVVREPFLFRLE